MRACMGNHSPRRHRYISVRGALARGGLCHRPAIPPVDPRPTSITYIEQGTKLPATPPSHPSPCCVVTFGGLGLPSLYYTGQDTLGVQRRSQAPGTDRRAEGPSGRWLSSPYWMGVEGGRGEDSVACAAGVQLKRLGRDASGWWEGAGEWAMGRGTG